MSVFGTKALELFLRIKKKKNDFNGILVLFNPNFFFFFLRVYFVLMKKQHHLLFEMGCLIM